MHARPDCQARLFDTGRTYRRPSSRIVLSSWTSASGRLRARSSHASRSWGRMNTICLDPAPLKRTQGKASCWIHRLTVLGLTPQAVATSAMDSGARPGAHAELPSRSLGDSASASCPGHAAMRDASTASCFRFASTTHNLSGCRAADLWNRRMAIRQSQPEISYFR